MRIDLLVNDFTWRAVKDRSVTLFEAHAKRNYVHIRDVCEAFIHAIAHFDTMRGKVYNVGDSRINLSKLELCERIKAHVPGFTFLQAAIGEDPDKRNYIVANDRIEATGWRPSHTLDEGIEELKKLYRTLRLTQHGNV